MSFQPKQTARLNPREEWFFGFQILVRYCLWAVYLAATVALGSSFFPDELMLAVLILALLHAFFGTTLGMGALGGAGCVWRHTRHLSAAVQDWNGFTLCPAP